MEEVEAVRRAADLRKWFFASSAFSLPWDSSRYSTSPKWRAAARQRVLLWFETASAHASSAAPYINFQSMPPGVVSAQSTDEPARCELPQPRG